MAIYSTHPSRGKVQILSTSESHRGWETETVTSIDDAERAAAIVEELNEVVGLAWAPYDDVRASHPRDHWDAVIDPSLREELLFGEDDLWYEYIKACLYYSLQRLDRALESLPPVVTSAIEAELRMEKDAGRGDNLRYTGRVLRGWNSDDSLPASFEDLDPIRAAQTIADIRLLLQAEAAGAQACFEILGDDLVELSNEVLPGGDGYHHLEVQLIPADEQRWNVVVYRSDKDTRGDWDGERSAEQVVECRLDEAPTVSEIVELFRLGGLDRQLARWANTRYGDELRGTPFVVTKKADRLRDEAQDRAIAAHRIYSPGDALFDGTP